MCKTKYENGTTVACENFLSNSTAICCLTEFVEGVRTNLHNCYETEMSETRVKYLQIQNITEITYEELDGTMASPEDEDDAEVEEAEEVSGATVSGEPNFTFSDPSSWNPPKYYDPRCRIWYENQYRKNHTTLSKIYKFTSGELGLTICAPLWNSRQYFGTYCLDTIPSSIDSGQLIDKVFKDHNQTTKINYLIFTEDEEFIKGNYMQSTYRDYLQEFLYTTSNISTSFTVLDITMRRFDTSRISSYLERFSNNYDLSLVQPVEHYVNVTLVSLQSNDTGKTYSQYCFINNFNMSLLPMNYSWFDTADNPEFYHLQAEDLSAPFHFALCIPGTYIDNFMAQVKKDIRRDLIDDYLIPLLATSFIVAVFVLFQLKKLSKEIT